MNFDGRLDNELITNIKSTESGELINEAITWQSSQMSSFWQLEVRNIHIGKYGIIIGGDNFNLDLIGAQTFLIKELYWINYRRTSLYK